MSAGSRPYLLVSRVEGVADRLIPAVSRRAALAIAADATWEATAVDPATVRALDHLGVKVETAQPEQTDLLGAEGGEG